MFNQVARMVNYGPGHINGRALFKYDVHQMETAVAAQRNYLTGLGLEPLVAMFKLVKEKGLSRLDRALAVGTYLDEMLVSALKKYRVRAWELALLDIK